MKSLDRDVKLNFMQIVFSPILSLWNMANNGEDITDEIKLNPKSSNNVESYLARSQEKLEKEYDKRVKKTTGIQGIEVDRSTLGNIKTISSKEDNTKESDDRVH